SPSESARWPSGHTTASQRLVVSKCALSGRFQVSGRSGFLNAPVTSYAKKKATVFPIIRTSKFYYQNPLILAPLFSLALKQR
ncbi:MAG: hypothetical protein IJQ81_01075, partial [Oscillibacter sp.]|nr:hypothetical protein [Oscillibacter sp.]